MKTRFRSAGYEIENGRIPVTISMKPLEVLMPHEEVVESELAAITQSILADQILRHPIIADKATGIVLDGTHRLKALQELHTHLAPVALVDYQNPLIKIDRWYRLVTPASLDDVWKDAEKAGYDATEREPTVAARLLESREVFTVIRDSSRSIVFHPRSSDDKKEGGIPDLVRRGSNVETMLRQRSYQVAFADAIPNPIPEKTLVLSMIKLEKNDVVASAPKGILYPPKSTRHLIPSRPLGARVPLSMLSIQEFEAAQSMLVEHLSRMKLSRVERGSVIGSRKYEEEVLLFV